MVFKKIWFLVFVFFKYNQRIALNIELTKKLSGEFSNMVYGSKNVKNKEMTGQLVDMTLISREKIDLIRLPEKS